MGKIEQRIEGLERSIRHYQVLLAMFTMVILAGILVAATSSSGGQDVIRCRKLELLDSRGKVRVKLGPLKENEEDTYVLEINGTKGEGVILIGVSDNDSGIYITQSSAYPSVALKVRKNSAKLRFQTPNSPDIILGNEDNWSALEFNSKPGQRASFSISDSKIGNRALIEANDNGTQFAIIDQNAGTLLKVP